MDLGAANQPASPSKARQLPYVASSSLEVAA